MLQADSQLLGLRTGRGVYGEKPPSSYQIYFWTIGDGRSPLDVAVQFDQSESLDAMLPFATPVQRLQFACRQGDEEMARGITREHPAIIQSMVPEQHRIIADAAWNGEARGVALMLDLGFNPRTPGHDSGTALHLAAWDGSAETVAALLRHPEAAELVSIRDAHHGGTPLGWCCHGSLHGNPSHDHAAVAQLLLEAGAKPGSETDAASPSVRSVLARWRH
jgi:ankyrin repeat protein